MFLFGNRLKYPRGYALGDLWVQVPFSIKVEFTGSLKRGVMVRDVAQKVIGDLGKDKAMLSAAEFTGPSIAEFSVDDRMTLCSRIISKGAYTAIINPDAKVITYAQGRAKAHFDPVTSDRDATYLKTLNYDLSTMEPVLAVSPTPVNTQPVSKLKRIRIDQAYIGSCAGGRLDELRMVGKILRNRKVHPHVKLIIVPSSLEILAGLAEENLLQIFIAAGALIGAPGCGACFGSHGCLLAGKEVCISTITSNLPGRMGSPEAQIYLGSSATVAASSIEGKLADPRDYF